MCKEENFTDITRRIGVVLAEKDIKQDVRNIKKGWGEAAVFHVSSHISTDDVVQGPGGRRPGRGRDGARVAGAARRAADAEGGPRHRPRRPKHRRHRAHKQTRY